MLNKCAECDNCNFEIEDFSGYTEARCKIAIPPKKGKIITWAHTVYANKFDCIIGNVAEHGVDRVKRELEGKKKPPKWCPLLLK